MSDKTFVTCPGCSAMYQVTPGAIGRKMKCPKCETRFTSVEFTPEAHVPAVPIEPAAQVLFDITGEPFARPQVVFTDGIQLQNERFELLVPHFCCDSLQIIGHVLERRGQILDLGDRRLSECHSIFQKNPRISNRHNRRCGELLRQIVHYESPALRQHVVENA